MPIIAAVTGLTNIAALVGSRSPAFGLLVHFLSSGLIGISYGLLFEHESPDFTAGIAWGLLYGLVWWFAGSLTFFPILQGLSFNWTRNAAANALPLMGVAGCSDFARTAEEHAATSYRVATYTDQSKESSDSRHVDSDPEPTYEWFY